MNCRITYIIRLSLSEALYHLNQKDLVIFDKVFFRFDYGVWCFVDIGKWVRPDGYPLLDKISFLCYTESAFFIGGSR